MASKRRSRTNYFMKRKSKIKLNDLKVKSFVTQLNGQSNIKVGGSTLIVCGSMQCFTDLGFECFRNSMFLGCEEQEGPDDEVSVIKPIGGGDQNIVSQVRIECP